MRKRPDLSAYLNIIGLHLRCECRNEGFVLMLKQLAIGL